MFQLDPDLFLAAHGLFFVTGLAGNIFILIAHFLDWMKTHDLNPCNLIIDSISFSNIFLQGTVVANQYVFNLFPKIYLQDWICKPFIVVMNAFALCSLFCFTSLCFYYCVKILNFKGDCFYRLKAKIPRIVPWVIIACIAMAWTFGLPMYWDLYVDFTIVPHILLTNYTAALTSQWSLSNNTSSILASLLKNATFTVEFSIKSRCGFLFQFYMAVSSAAFLAIFVATVAILTSLCKHMRKMVNNKSTTNIATHLSAAKTVTALLICYLIFYVALNLIFNYPRSDNMLLPVCFVVASSFPTINAIILITGNRKLMNDLRGLFGIRPSAGTNEVSVASQ